MSSGVDDDAVVEELGRYRAEYLPVALIPEDTRESLPRLWIEAAESEASAVGGLLADQWRRLCPGFPRIADVVERRTRRVVIATMERAKHWTKCPPGQDNETWAEPALVYLLGDESGSGELDICFGWRPYRSDAWPAGSEEIRGLVGRLFGELQNGFVDYFDTGLLPVEDWHSMAEMPFDGWRFAANDGAASSASCPVDQGATVIPAENPASWSHVIVAPVSPPSIWVGHNDNLRPSSDLAAAIDYLVGGVWEGTA